MPQIPEVSFPLAEVPSLCPASQGRSRTGECRGLFQLCWLTSLCPLWCESARSQGHPSTAMHVAHMIQLPTRDAIKRGQPGLVVFQRQGYGVRVVGNNASSSFVTFLNKASVHKPEVFILKSIVLIVLFGKINEELGRHKWDPGHVNTKRLEWGVGPRSCSRDCYCPGRRGLAAKIPEWLLWEKRAAHATKMYQTYVGKAAVFHYPQAP